MIVEKFSFFSSIRLDIFIFTETFLFDIIRKIFIINLYKSYFIFCIQCNAGSSMDYTYPCCAISNMVI